MSKDTLLATALRVLRETRSLTQKELAEVSGIERNTISKYENGWIQPSREKLRALLDALGFGYSELEEAEQFVQRLRLGAEGSALASTVSSAQSAPLGDLLASGPRGRQIRQASEELGRYLGVLLELVAARPGAGDGGRGGGGGEGGEGGGDDGGSG